MSKPATLEKFRQHLFTDSSELELSKSESAKLLRYRDVYVQWLENPSMTKAELRDYILNNHQGISETQVYRELHEINILLGNVQNASRAHIQFIVNETLLKIIGDLTGDKKHYKELILALDKLAKYNQLDKDAPEPVDWSEMVGFEIEPTSDPSVIGAKKMKNLEEVKAMLYKKYADGIEDIQYEDVKPNGET